MQDWQARPRGERRGGDLMGYRMVSLLLVVFAFAWCGVAASQSPAKPLVADPALTRSMDQVLKDVSSIQSGMTRTELLRIFTTEGGLSTRDEQRYVYRRCPYIKVMVTFRRPMRMTTGAARRKRSGPATLFYPSPSPSSNIRSRTDGRLFRRLPAEDCGRPGPRSGQ